MTKNESVERPSQGMSFSHKKRKKNDLASDDTQQQQQQKSFQVVLVDIKQAADKNIICVEKPLEADEKELSFVALSYRWGELHEQIVNTHLGYLATITSFDLDDFYRLCEMMTKEPDLKHIKYVWVDAICVDQTNYERRKATIHQMSNIYDKATYILAVPDLHKKHLENASMAYSEIMHSVSNLDEYIYHLIQGNTERLVELDDIFLNEINVPEDRTLRKLLAGFTTYPPNDYFDDPKVILHFLCKIYQASNISTWHEDIDRIKSETQKENAHDKDDDPLDGSLLDYDKVTDLLEGFDDRWMEIARGDMMWTHALIERGNDIRQAMQFLEDLIKDWSTRVWVISEYHIAKEKNNLKYWFIQLYGPSFFKFEFTNPTFSSDIENSRRQASIFNGRRGYDISFHNMIFKQVNAQEFLEMMLKSKASKNEDRFYAILPLSKYKDKVSQVDQWNISTLISVKLKLFEIMDAKDKWTLLFLAANKNASNTYQVLPTFCASNIDWNDLANYVQGNAFKYDMNSESSTITFHHTNNLHLYYIRLTIMEYYVYDGPDDLYKYPKAKKTLYNHLQVDKDSLLEMVLLHPHDGKARSPLYMEEDCYDYGISLVGSFVENKWTLCDETSIFEVEYFHRHYNDDHSTVFDIY
ncbi:unnamed protein product [Absidia cylindrospora]